jgi:hypothetical protein
VEFLRLGAFHVAEAGRAPRWSLGLVAWCEASL